VEQDFPLDLKNAHEAQEGPRNNTNQCHPTQRSFAKCENCIQLPELSIICMRQVIEIVEFKSEFAKDP
jgi:hypothetical protein